MKEVRGDLWTYPSDCRVIPTNGKLCKDGSLVMGAGVARDAAARFPGLAALLGGYVKLYGNRAFYLVSFDLISFPTKHDWAGLADPDLIEVSARQAMEIATKFELCSVVLPQVGCGLGGMQWKDVSHILRPILDNRFVVVS